MLSRVSHPEMAACDSETHHQEAAEAWPMPLRPGPTRPSLSKVTFTGPELRRGAAAMHTRRGPGSRHRAGDAGLRETRPDPREWCPARERTRGRSKPHGQPVVFLYNEQFSFICSFVKSFEKGGITVWQVSTELGPRGELVSLSRMTLCMSPARPPLPATLSPTATSSPPRPLLGRLRLHLVLSCPVHRALCGAGWEASLAGSPSAWHRWSGGQKSCQPDAACGCLGARRTQKLRTCVRPKFERQREPRAQELRDRRGQPPKVRAAFSAGQAGHPTPASAFRTRGAREGERHSDWGPKVRVACPGAAAPTWPPSAQLASLGVPGWEAQCCKVSSQVWD